MQRPRGTRQAPARNIGDVAAFSAPVALLGRRQLQSSDKA